MQPGKKNQSIQFSKQKERQVRPGTRERQLQVEAFFSSMRKKYKEDQQAKKATRDLMISQLPKIIPKKPTVSKPVGRVRKPYIRRLKKPQPWANARLYKVLIERCGKIFGEFKARERAEQYMEYLCKQVSIVKRRRVLKNYQPICDDIKKSLYYLGIIKSMMDYFVFIEKYLPWDYRTKVIECQKAYGVVTGIPIPPGTDLFADMKL